MHVNLKSKFRYKFNVYTNKKSQNMKILALSHKTSKLKVQLFQSMVFKKNILKYKKDIPDNREKNFEHFQN